MPSIGVLEHFQKPTDKPTRRIKRSGGHSLVRQCRARWIKENVLLQMIDSAKTEHRFCRPPMSEVIRYIPEKMPWAELPGVKFVDPVSKTATQNQAVKRRFFVMAANRIAGGI